MSDDYGFLKTGFSTVQTQPAVDIDFMRRLASIMKVLLKKAIGTAERFAHACGRTVITGHDTRLALKYESHEFCLRPDLESEFAIAFEEELNHTYETDDSEDDSEEEEAPIRRAARRAFYNGPA